MRKTIGILIIMLSFIAQIVLFCFLVENYQIFDDYDLNANFTISSIYLLALIMIGVKLLTPANAINDIPRNELQYKLEYEIISKIRLRILLTLPYNLIGIWSILNLLICWTCNSDYLLAGITIDFILISLNFIIWIVISFRLGKFFKGKTINYKFYYGEVHTSNGIKEYTCNMENLIFLFRYEKYFVCMVGNYGKILILPIIEL